MSDRGHELTEELLEELEEEIKREYEKAVKDVEKKLQDYLEKTEKGRLEQKALLDAGKITQKQYNDWVYRHTMVGKRWEATRDALAKDMVHADAIAQGLIRGKMPDVYALNMNFATFQIEHDGRIDTGFNLYNRDSAQYLLGDQRELMPGPSAKKSAEIRANKDMQWNSRHIQSAVLQGILQGESPYDVAARLRQVGQMDASASIRYARTMTTSAQNAGRYDAFRRARNLGVQLTIEWQATLDNRTRHEHRMMHGQRRNVDEPFVVDGIKILYPAEGGPGSSDIPQYLIWNCRCTLLSWVKGFEGDTVKSSPGMGDMSFEEWQQAKAHPDTKADRDQFEEYKKLLGKDVPMSYNAFRKLKYDDPTAWAGLKEQAHMERVIRNAPCELTKKKFSGYFLKPGAKHADDFFGVGYTERDVRRLRYDMARQFDVDKAVSRKNNGYGVEHFDIIMQLGTEKQGRFITGWQVDNEGDKPRIVTAFRRELKND
jgi:SPP1 gp7 family putative phage head morphogenesis protein